jgi:hypothetical protein
MPNLIHTLDSAFLNMLRNQLSLVHVNYTNFTAFIIVLQQQLIKL